MGNTERLVSAVLKHAGEQHEDTAWSHVTEAMTRYDIAAVVVSAEARTPRQASGRCATTSTACWCSSDADAGRAGRGV